MRGGETDLAVARRVIRAEIGGLESLAAALDGAFGAAVDLCAAARGRIVVTGVGKSGHVGRKIAATLASTGTPAQFVHAGEASHGDLGMIGAEDAILALSNSGETAEFADIIAYSRRFGIPLIAITGGGGSTLAAAADAVLLLPAGAPRPARWASRRRPRRRSMMALGDALAIALLERRGFSTADFRVLHPGGRLGRRLLRVADIMHVGGDMPLVPPAARDVRGDPGDDRQELWLRRRLRRRRAADRRRHRRRSAPAYGRFAARPARWRRSCIARRGRSAPRRSPPKALGLMNRTAITSLFVVDDGGRPIGFLHMHDCLRAGIA